MPGERLVGIAQDMRVRAELPEDAEAVARLNDAAFGGPVESRLVEAVRRAGHRTVSLVALVGSEIVGHILFTPVTVEAPGPAIPAMGLGPMAVLPQWQRRGIGSRLVASGLEECNRIGCRVVVVVGHPHFYPRFGFRPAHLLGLRSEYAVPDDVFMAMELKDAALTGHSGLVRYLPEFGSV